MKYTPGEIPEGINVAPTDPIREFLVLAAGLVGILLISYFLLGFAADRLVGRLTPDQERKLGSLLAVNYPVSKASPKDGPLEKLTGRIAAGLDRPAYPFRVAVACGPAVNALALPGGTILLFEGLLRAVRSENELATVLGHEIAHFQHRDHLRGLGRGLVFLMLLSAVTEGQSDTSGLANWLGSLVALRFSRSQEGAADELGAELVVKAYGHAGGVSAFFERLESGPASAPGGSWFATHPDAEWRARRLEEITRARGWSVGSLEPLAAGWVDAYCRRRL